MMAVEQGRTIVQPVTTNDEGYNMHLELIHSVLNRVSTATLVMIKSVDSTKKIVNAQPLVTQVDGSGKPISHGIIYGIPYLPLQYGSNAILMTPTVGDIGLCVFCHHDISNVKATKKEALPASFRRHSYSDGVYLGGILGAAPTQFIEFKDGNINITATNINITGTLKNNGVLVGSTHVHGGVQTGGGNTAVPH